MRSEKDVDQVFQLARHIPFFQKVKQDYVSNRIILNCCKHMQHHYLERGKVLFHEGDEASDFFVILEGEVAVKVRYHGELRQIDTIQSGGSFGELAIIENQPRNATIQTLRDTQFAKLNKEIFNMVLSEYENQQIVNEISYLMRVPLFRNMQLKDVRQEVFVKSQRMKFQYNETVYRQNDIVTSVYVIKSGEFALFKEIEIPLMAVNRKHPNQRRQQASQKFKVARLDK